MTKNRWVDRPRDSSLILTYHQRPKRNTAKKERKITEVKRALQSTKWNRTPKVEKPEWNTV